MHLINGALPLVWSLVVQPFVTSLLTSSNTRNTVCRDVRQGGLMASRRDIIFGIVSTSLVVAPAINQALAEESRIPDSFDIESYLTMMVFPIDYEQRAQLYNFSPPNEIKEALSNHETVLMDVRSLDEIKLDGRITSYDNTNKVVQTSCTVTECPELSASPETILGNNYKNVTIVVYCASGRRSSVAKAVLKEKGAVGRILIAGGYEDLKAALNL